jgi:hypothetical protein
MSDETTLHSVAEKATAFLEQAREQARDGLTWTEFGRIMVQLLYLVVAGLDAVAGLTGQQKAAIAAAASGQLFDLFADRCVPPWLYPFWLVVRTPFRALILAISAGAVEALLRISRSVAT